jgi:hypothetical protein
LEIKILLEQRPDLEQQVNLLTREGWPTFMLHADTPYWARLYDIFAGFQIKFAPEALVVMGTVAEWEEWTGMRFPESGEYVIPGVLQPITIDRERNAGRYVDPNVWMRHPTA